MVKKHKKALKGSGQRGIDDKLKQFHEKIQDNKDKRDGNNTVEKKEGKDGLLEILEGADSLHDFDVTEGHGRASNAHDALVALAQVDDPGPEEELLAEILGALSKSDKVQGVDNKGKRDFSISAINDLCDLKPDKKLTYEWGVTALMDDCGFLKLEQGDGPNLMNNENSFANEYGAGITWKTMIDSAKNPNSLDAIIKEFNECNVGNILVIHQGHSAGAGDWKEYRKRMKEQPKTQTSIECRAFRKVILSFLFPNIKVDEVGVGFTYDAGASQAKQPTNVIFEKASINSNNNNGDFIAVTPANMIDSAVAPRSYVPAGAVQGSPAHLKQKKTKGTLRKLRLALDAYNSTQKKFIFPSTDGAPDSTTYKYSGETTFFSNKFGVEITLKDNGFGPNNPMGFDLNVESTVNNEVGLIKFTIPYHNISQMSILQGPSAPFLASMMWKRGVNTINKKGQTQEKGFSNQIVGVPKWVNETDANHSPSNVLNRAAAAKSAAAARGPVNEIWDSLLFDFKRSGDYEQIEAMIHATKNPVEPFFGVLCTVDILAALRARQRGLPAILVGTGPVDDKYLICYRPRKKNACENEDGVVDPVSGLRGGNRGKIKINKIMKGGVMTREQRQRAEISHIRGITSFVKNMVTSKISTILSLPSNAELNAKGQQLSHYLQAQTDTLQIKMAFQCYRIYYDILKNLDNYFNRVSTQSACVVGEGSRVSRDYNSIQIDVPDTRNFLIDMMNIKKQVKGFLSNHVTTSYRGAWSRNRAFTNPLLQKYIFDSLNLISSNPIPKSTRSQRKATIETYVQKILSPIITASGYTSFRAFFAVYSKNLWTYIIAYNWPGGTESQNPLDAFNTKKLSDDFLDALKEMIAETLGISDAEQINTVDNKILGQIYRAVVALNPQQDIQSQDQLFESDENKARWKNLQEQIKINSSRTPEQLQHELMVNTQQYLLFKNNLKYFTSNPVLFHHFVSNSTLMTVNHPLTANSQQMLSTLEGQIGQEIARLYGKMNTLDPREAQVLIKLLDDKIKDFPADEDDWTDEQHRVEQALELVQQHQQDTARWNNLQKQFSLSPQTPQGLMQELMENTQQYLLFKNNLKYFISHPDSANRLAANPFMTVTVPQGAQPGQSITVQTPPGQQIQVQVPRGVFPDQQFHVRYVNHPLTANSQQMLSTLERQIGQEIARLYGKMNTRTLDPREAQVLIKLLDDKIEDFPADKAYWTDEQHRMEQVLDELEQQFGQQHQQQDDDGVMEIEDDLGGGAKKRVMHGGANEETALLFILCTWDNLFNLDFSPFEYFTSPDITKLKFLISKDAPNHPIFGDSWMLPTGKNVFTLDSLNDIFIAYMNETMNQLSATATKKSIVTLADTTTAQYPLNGPYLLNFPYTKDNINGYFLSTGLPNNTWPLVLPPNHSHFQGYCHDGVIVYFPRMGRTYVNNCDLLRSRSNEDRIKQQGILNYVLSGDTSGFRGGRKRKKKTRKRKKRKYKTLRRRKRNRKHSLKRKKRKRKTRFKK